ncbi:MAG TPA: type II toxin-antitoxin system Phd/YefM family antitoxin [Acetobacteraceae bacterium]|nr:type II toxin-antitoxin system Phd/YefM family antitoxin [Acetobacteraceae bacterium]
MKEIGAFGAKTKLGRLLDWDEAGEEVVITRRGKVVAKLVPLMRPASIATAPALPHAVSAKCARASRSADRRSRI